MRREPVLQYSVLRDGRLNMTKTEEQPRTGVVNTTNKNKPQKDTVCLPDRHLCLEQTQFGFLG